MVSFAPRRSQIYNFVCDFLPWIADLSSAACNFLVHRVFSKYNNDLSFFYYLPPSYPQKLLFFIFIPNFIFLPS